MFGFVAFPSIVSEHEARASREDVTKHFSVAGAAIGTARPPLLRGDDQLLRRPIHNQSDASTGVLVRRRHGRGLQTVQWREEDLRQEGWRPLGTYQDASDPEHGEATIYIKDEAVRICHSIYGPVPCSDGVVLQHDDDEYSIQMNGMRGRIDTEGFHCSGYLNPLVAAPPPSSPEPKVSRQPVTSASITESELQTACRNLATILGKDFEGMINPGSASNALLSEIRAMGDDYGGLAFEADRQREESSKQQILGKQSLRQLRRQIFVPGAGRFFVEAAYDSWRRSRTYDAFPPQLVRYVLRHHAFWAVARNARRLDEVEEAVQADAAELKNKPKFLLQRIEQERKKRPGNALHRARKDKPFEHLQRIPPLPVPGKPLEFRVLSTAGQVRDAAERLKNCAATYIPKVVAKKFALVGLFQKQKGDRDKMSEIIAMGQLFVDISKDGSIVTTWRQRVRTCNTSLTNGQRKHFNRAARGLAKLWTKAIEDEIDRVLPRQVSSGRAIAESADQTLSAIRRLGRPGLQLALRKLAMVIDSEGYTPEWKSLAKGFVQHVVQVKPPVTGTIPDVIIGSCLAIAGMAQDSNLLRTIMS
ncbi:unnamed protein product [Symbiodinium sp. CCMP2456]|nr:unnamed protein product [Symbiodinium sp. CCMP2456]